MIYNHTISIINRIVFTLNFLDQQQIQCKFKPKDKHKIMQLPQQLLVKLRNLTDKPVSEKVNKQLYKLLLHENLQLDNKMFLTICQKYRCDLVNYLFKNGRIPTQGVLAYVIGLVLSKILEYKIAEVLEMYILILDNIEPENTTRLLQIGYQQPIKLAVKLPNLETKQKLLQIILSNTEYFYKQKYKKIITTIFTNYLELFTKFLIYVPSYISMIQLGFDIDLEAKKILNLPHPQREPRLQQIFIDLSSKELSQVKNQLLLILENTKQKINYYSLHKNCLNALKKLGQMLSMYEGKIKEAQLYFTEVEVGACCRLIQIFVDRKGVIDQARVCRDVWLKRFQYLKKIKELKSQKYIYKYDHDNPSLLIRPPQAPLLIEQVISRTNNYRLKYQVAPTPVDSELDSHPSNSRIVSVSNNFLKKGIGIGGGRTHLLNKKQGDLNSYQRERNKGIYDDIVGKCFEQVKKDIEYKSYVDKKVKLEQEQDIIEQFLDTSPKKQLSPQKSQFNLTINLDRLPAFSSTIFQNDERNQQQKYKSNNSRIVNNRSLVHSYVSSYEQDQDVQQINNLIQLAYSYKFS